MMINVYQKEYFSYALAYNIREKYIFFYLKCMKNKQVWNYVVFFSNLSCLYFKKMNSVFSLTLLLCYFFLSMTGFSIIRFPFLLYLPTRLSLHRVGILLPPSLLGRAPSRGSHGLFRRTADRVSLCLSLLSWLPLPGISFCMTCPSLPPPLPFSDLQACAKPALPGSPQLTLPLTACEQTSM